LHTLDCLRQHGSLFGFSLCERKTEQQKMEMHRCGSSHAGTA
jgi:hypothetical protein